jgi:protein gp37
VIAETPQHSYQVLTKRARRLRRIADQLEWPPNLWMGVSVENSAALDRADDLRDVPAAVRFLSCEPLLGPLDDLDLTGIHWVIAGGESGSDARPMHPSWLRALRDQCIDDGVPFLFKQWGAWAGLGTVDAPPDGWVHNLTGLVVTSEQEALDSLPEPHGRAPDPDQRGRFHGMWKVGKKAAGRELDGRTWDEFPAPRL